MRSHDWSVLILKKIKIYTFLKSGSIKIVRFDTINNREVLYKIIKYLFLLTVA